MVKGFKRTHKARGRRAFLKALAAMAAGAASAKNWMAAGLAKAQTGPSGFPLPDEPVEATLNRLFGSRQLIRADDKIKLDLPLIAEDGGNVGVTVESQLPVTGPLHLKHIYIISDKNRRPLLAKFSFTPESGRAFVSTSLRLATSTDVRAIAEMSDGTLYMTARPVRVTISGCDVPS